MNNITEQALLTDLGNLKGQHNKLATQMQADMNKAYAAIRQLMAWNKALEARLAALEAATSPQTNRAPTRIRINPAQPTISGASAASAAESPAAPIHMPATLADPSTGSVGGWVGEEDADVVE